MSDVRIIDTRRDGQRAGIPQANLSALRAFLDARRDTHSRDVSEEMAELPKEVQDRINLFLRHAKHVSYLKPDGVPRPEWKVFYGDTWAEARGNAWHEIHRVGADPTYKKPGGSGLYWKDSVSSGYRQAINASILPALKDAGRFWLEWVAYQLVKDTLGRKLAMTEDKKENGEVDMELRELNSKRHGVSCEAERMVKAIAASDLRFARKKRSMEYVRRRWEVWEKGYGLEDEINGVLHVSCKGEAPR